MRYRETQRVAAGWLWLAVLAVASVVWFGAFQQLVRGRPWGTSPVSDPVILVIWTLVGLGIPALLAASRLETEVDDRGIRVRLFPFHRRGVGWSFDRIAEAFPRDYKPIREYGGWGIRLGLGSAGRADNARGSRGVQLVLRDGRRVLIGSQHPERLAAAIQAGLDVSRADP
jgi:hypothetical protein